MPPKKNDAPASKANKHPAPPTLPAPAPAPIVAKMPDGSSFEIHSASRRERADTLRALWGPVAGQKRPAAAEAAPAESAKRPRQKPAFSGTSKFARARAAKRAEKEKEEKEKQKEKGEEGEEGEEEGEVDPASVPLPVAGDQMDEDEDDAEA
ncbi:hypothetical protein VPNG_02775 [Cytospora leucostoma]|uniref:Uncharacterized protein n=1 Tax=Cytospora leucostoma TaxID=1230097 RepID=A0A423XJI0_9PEZI|nr:hypothetical protein VPNG_02775 [Cytospora leucostoma]